MANDDKEVTDNATPECPICRDAKALEPNAKTIVAINELRDGQGKMLNSIDELMADLNSDDEE